MTYAITAGGKQHSLDGSGHWFHRPLSDDDLASLDPDMAERIRATVEAAVNANIKHENDRLTEVETNIPTLFGLEPDDGGVDYFAIHEGKLYGLEGISWDEDCPKEMIERLSLGLKVKPAQEAPPVVDQPVTEDVNPS